MRPKIDAQREYERREKRGHYCYDWDEGWICEDDPEFEACACNRWSVAAQPGEGERG